MRELIERRPGEETVFHLDGDTLAVERRFDSAPVLREIRDIRACTDGRSATGEMYHVGRLPAAVIEGYCNRRGVTFADFLADPSHAAAILTDNEYRDLRIWEGSL